MSHILRLTSERTYVQLGQTKRAETVRISIILTPSRLMSGARKAGPDHHLRSDICGLQSLFGLVLRCLVVLGTISRAIRMLCSCCYVLSPCALCRAT